SPARQRAVRAGVELLRPGRPAAADRRQVPGDGAYGEVDRRRDVPHHADGVPGQAHVRHAPRHEVLHCAPAAERPHGTVLRLQHAVPRRHGAAAAPEVMTRPQLLYSLFQVLALIVALLLRRPSPLPRRDRWVVTVAALFGAGVGAKLPFALLS